MEDVPDVRLLHERRVHHDAVVDRLGLDSQEVGLEHRAQARVAGDRLVVRLHELDAVRRGDPRNGEGDGAAAGAGLEDAHAGLYVGQFQQTGDDRGRGGEEVELVLGDLDFARDDDLVDPLGGVAVEQVGLRLAVPLAAGGLEDFVGALVELALQLADQGQGRSAGFGPAKNGEDFVVDSHAVHPSWCG